mgnify:CR=1 FL=1
MVEVKVDLCELPADVGFILVDRTGKTPKRFYNDVEIEKVWSCIHEKIQGKKDVDLLVIGFMPCVMPARLTFHCMKSGVNSFSICRPGGLVEIVYNLKVEA